MRESRAATILWQPEGVRVPTNLTDLGTFRRWARSDAFPEKYRIDWIDGEMEIDMSPEDLNTHGSPKLAIARKLAALVEDGDRGMVYVEATRMSVPAADLSAEPDVVVVVFETVESERIRLIPRARGGEGRFVELEGPADLVVECVSDSSENKDLRRLKEAYGRAGVPEYWLVDARVSPPLLTVHRNARRACRAVARHSDGFTPSSVLGVAVRLRELQPRAGLVRYRLETRPL